MRITSKGQVTIPQDIRERLGLLPNTDVEFAVERGVAGDPPEARHAVARRAHRRPPEDPWGEDADEQQGAARPAPG